MGIIDVTQIFCYNDYITQKIMSSTTTFMNAYLLHSSTISKKFLATLYQILLHLLYSTDDTISFIPIASLTSPPPATYSNLHHRLSPLESAFIDMYQSPLTSPLPATYSNLHHRLSPLDSTFIDMY